MLFPQKVGFLFQYRLSKQMHSIQVPLPPENHGNFPLFRLLTDTETSGVCCVLVRFPNGCHSKSSASQKNVCYV